MRMPGAVPWFLSKRVQPLPADVKRFSQGLNFAAVRARSATAIASSQRTTPAAAVRAAPWDCFGSPARQAGLVFFLTPLQLTNLTISLVPNRAITPTKPLLGDPTCVSRAAASVIMHISIRSGIFMMHHRLTFRCFARFPSPAGLHKCTASAVNQPQRTTERKVLFRFCELCGKQQLMLVAAPLILLTLAI